MADPVIGATVQVVLEKLLSLTLEEISSFSNYKKDLNMLTQNVSMIQAFICDAERRQVEDQPVEIWLQRLEKVAEGAEYLFDEIRYQSLKSRVIQTRSKPMKKVCNFLSRTAFRCKMSRKMKNINEELKAINQLASGLALRPQGGPSSRQMLPVRETDSVVVASDVVGRDEDIDEIKKKMLDMGKDDALCTIPIVGMRGLGKTTIAKRIFNDEHIKNLFAKRVWVCLPEMLETTSFLVQILESLTKKKVEVQIRDVIVRELQDQLGGKRYLFVLDDLWLVDHTVWNGFIDTLKAINTSRGNCILVTTRMSGVASAVAVDAHVLGKLATDHCWSIFKQKAFADREVPEELASMSNKVVELCKGLPLAASVLGGLLRNKEKSEWQAILDSNRLVDEGGERSLKKILKLSYDYLPSPHLKKCFAYFAMFPKDFEFEKDQLIQLWMAEGFLPPCQEIPVMEDVGNMSFQLLLQFSLLQDVRLDEDDNKTYCKMHDLVHDLAVNIFKSKLFDPKGVQGENPSQVRYVGWESPTDQIDQINEPGRLCTLFWRGSYIEEELLLRFQFLRVLNLSMSDITELPASIGKLIYLRYLDVSYTKIRALPNSICKLYNLQTLRFYNFRFMKFPDELGNMISLRHIHFNTFHQMPLKMGQLTCLQTLGYFRVGSEKGRRIEELGCLKNLRGDLKIDDLQLVCNREEAQIAHLQEKPNIHMLTYSWAHGEREGSGTNGEREGSGTNDEGVLDGLQPHPNLKTLRVEGYLGIRFPSWLREELLPSLVELRLRKCNECKEIPSFGQLKLLKNLQLENFDKLECIGPAFYGFEVKNNGSSSSSANIRVFPSLKTLVLEDMPSLTEWKEMQLIPTGKGGRDGVGIRMFPRLEEMTIRWCPRLKSVPTQFEVLRELSIYGGYSAKPLLDLCSNLTSLVKLRIYNVEGLTRLPDEILQNNSSLQHLQVYGCRKFRELPQSLYNLHSLRSLTIERCKELEYIPVPSGQNHLTSLVNLGLEGCRRLTSLPSGMLEHCQSIENLTVWNCHNLISFPLHCREKPSLSRIDIIGCHKLKSVATGGLHHLSGLRTLRIGPFQEFVDLEAFLNGIQQLSSLDTLGVYGREDWDALPNQLMQLSALRKLSINDFGIEALPHGLGNLTSLKKLSLQGCKRLQHLDLLDAMPKLQVLMIRECPLLEAQPFGDVMQRLATLHRLEVVSCPLLENCWTNRSGQNSLWSKISHIPTIRVDGEAIQDITLVERGSEVVFAGEPY